MTEKRLTSSGRGNHYRRIRPHFNDVPGRSHGAVIQHARPLPDKGFWRGLRFGIPIAAFLWLAIIAGCFAFWFLLDRIEAVFR